MENKTQTQGCGKQVPHKTLGNMHIHLCNKDDLCEECKELEDE